MNKLNQNINNIFQILSLNRKINLSDCQIKITDSQIITPVGDVSSILYHNMSALKDSTINLDKLKELILILDKNDSIVRLNHVGFGYLVEDKLLERHRLIDLVRKTDMFLYEEESNDFGLWLFIGDLSNWENPLVEFVPVKNNEQNIDFFLPHIQIDIDTTLNEEEIESLIYKVFDGVVKPYRIAVINGITYIVRNRLGVISGINFFLDLATKSRNVRYHRQNILKKIS